MRVHRKMTAKQHRPALGTLVRRNVLEKGHTQTLERGTDTVLQSHNIIIHKQSCKIDGNKRSSQIKAQHGQHIATATFCPPCYTKLQTRRCSCRHLHLRSTAQHRSCCNREPPNLVTTFVATPTRHLNQQSLQLQQRCTCSLTQSMPHCCVWCHQTRASAQSPGSFACQTQKLRPEHPR